MIECWVICLAAILVTHQMDPVQLIITVVYGDGQSHICGGSKWSDHCACLTGSDVTGIDMTFSPTFFPVLFPPVFYFPYFFPPYSPGTFSKVAMFEIQRFKISVSCFSSTCRYSTVHVPCGISIQTSTVVLPLDGWDARSEGTKNEFI
jgi:hypothetical protein